MRALFGGAIGAVVAAAAWLAVDHFTHANLGWLVVLVGLVTGSCVHRAGGGRSSFAGGALAIILTLAAIAGGQQVYAIIMKATSTSATAVEFVAIDSEATAGEDDPATENNAPREVVALELEEPAADLADRSYSKSSIKKNFSEWDMVWMCLAALAAYVTGKGSDQPTSPAATQPQETAEVQPEAGPSDEDQAAAAKQPGSAQDEQG